MSDCQGLIADSQNNIIDLSRQKGQTMSLKDYYMAVYRNPDIPDDIKKVYTSAIRQEMHNNEKEGKKVCMHFESEEELYDNEMMISKVTETETENKAKEKEMELLYHAMNMLRENNPDDYKILTDYFFADGTVTMEKLAEKHGITRQTVSNRLQKSYDYLRTVITGLLNNN